MTQLRSDFAKIRREHIEEACREVLRRGLARGGGAYFVRFEGEEIAAKLILRHAFEIANNREVSSKEFSGGQYTARILEALGFEVVVRSRRASETTS
jgi:hypothetical protein